MTGVIQLVSDSTRKGAKGLVWRSANQLANPRLAWDFHSEDRAGTVSGGKARDRHRPESPSV